MRVRRSVLKAVGILASVLLSGCAAGINGGSGGLVNVPGRTCYETSGSFKDGWAAAHKALEELGLPLDSQQDNGSSGVITSRTSTGVPITINITTVQSQIPIDGLMTRFCVKVGPFGDQDVGSRILSQINRSLPQAPSLNRAAALQPPQQPATPTWTPPRDQPSVRLLPPR